MRHFLAAAILLATTCQAIASDPVIVIRPPSVTLTAGVLPMNAFQTTPSNPGTTSPTTPVSDGYVFKSFRFDDTDYELNVQVRSATVSKSGPNNGRWDNPWLPSGFCQITREESGDSRKKTDVMYVPDMTWSSKEERFVEPYVTGKMALVFFCDAVPNAPNGIYAGKVVLTVTP